MAHYLSLYYNLWFNKSKTAPRLGGTPLYVPYSLEHSFVSNFTNKLLRIISQDLLK